MNLTIKHKDKQRLYKFFVIPGNYPSLQGMLDIEMPGNLKWNGAQETSRNKTDQQTTSGKESHIYKDLNSNLKVTNKVKYKNGLLVEGPEK